MINIKLHPSVTTISGTIFVVVRHHSMGMDGDYYDPIAAYTSKEAAQNKLLREELHDEHVNRPYDNVYYEIEEIDLIC